MPTKAELTLEAELTKEERAIRHLIGEQKALNSKLARQRALRKLNQAKLAKLEGKRKPAAAIPHGDRFFDVSGYQPNVDFAAAHGDKALRIGQLAITKLTEGVSITDPYGKIRLKEIHDAGFVHVGAYAFGHPADGGVAMAEHFLAEWEASGQKLDSTCVVIYDGEVTDGCSPRVVAQAAADFGDTISKHTDAVRWLYGGGPFLKENGVRLDGHFHAHWLCAYASDYRPYVIYPGRTVAWQYSDGVYGPTPHGVSGVGAVDMSIVL